MNVTAAVQWKDLIAARILYHANPFSLAVKYRPGSMHDMYLKNNRK